MPKLGTFTLPKSWAPENYGPRFKAFHDFLCDAVTTFEPDVLAFEGPFLPRGTSAFSSTEHTLRTLIGLATIAELVANLRGLRCFEVNVSTAKLFFTGNGRAEKKEMLAEAWRRGWQCADDHQSDACAVACVVYGHLEEGDDDV
jgi:Holliday junction resolvasome RuvABC endonuclease subunit